MPATTGVQGLRGPGQFSVDHRPTNYRELYTMLEPNGSAPMNALLSMGNSEETDDAKYTNFRDEMPDRTFLINNGGGYNTATTTLQLDTGSQVGYVVVGTVIVNTRTGELMRATANGDTVNDQITVTRNVGSTSFSILDNDELIIAGSAHADGSGAPSAISWDAETAYNYTQIFKTPYSVSGQGRGTFFRTGSKEDELAEKALKLHMSDIERAMIYGRRAEVNGSTNSVLRYTGGLMNTITTVEDCATHGTAGLWTEDEFDAWLIDTCFAWGSKQKVVMAGPQFISNFQSIAKNRWNPTMIENTYGVSVSGYQTFAGELGFHLHPQFRQIAGLSSTGIFLDFQYLKYRHFKGRDTHIQENIQANDEDLVKHQYFTDCGLELLQDKPHSIVKGWTDVSA